MSTVGPTSVIRPLAVADVNPSVIDDDRRAAWTFHDQPTARGCGRRVAEDHSDLIGRLQNQRHRRYGRGRRNCGVRPEFRQSRSDDRDRPPRTPPTLVRQSAGRRRFRTVARRSERTAWPMAKDARQTDRAHPPGCGRSAGDRSVDDRAAIFAIVAQSCPRSVRMRSGHSSTANCSRAEARRPVLII